MHMSAIYRQSGLRNSAKGEIEDPSRQINASNLEVGDAENNYSIDFDCPSNQSIKAYRILKKHNPHTIDPVLEFQLRQIEANRTTMAIFIDSNNVYGLIQEIVSLDVPLRNINVLGGIFIGHIAVFVDSSVDQADQVREILNKHNPVHIFSSPQASLENQSSNR